MTIGERMRIRRNELKLPVEKLAERVGISPDTIIGYESGEERIPGYLLELIAKALYTTPAYLMGREEDELSAEEAVELMREMYELPHLNVSFVASRKVKAEDIKAVGELLKSMTGGDEDNIL